MVVLLGAAGGGLMMRFVVLLIVAFMARPAQAGYFEPVLRGHSNGKDGAN
jgi:hypothetical protein